MTAVLNATAIEIVNVCVGASQEHFTGVVEASGCQNLFRVMQVVCPDPSFCFARLTLLAWLSSAGSEIGARIAARKGKGQI